jgi:hypothetical protein
MSRFAEEILPPKRPYSGILLGDSIVKLMLVKLTMQIEEHKSSSTLLDMNR